MANICCISIALPSVLNALFFVFLEGEDEGFEGACGMSTMVPSGLISRSSSTSGYHGHSPFSLGKFRLCSLSFMTYVTYMPYVTYVTYAVNEMCVNIEFFFFSKKLNIPKFFMF